MYLHRTIALLVILSIAISFVPVSAAGPQTYCVNFVANPIGAFFGRISMALKQVHSDYLDGYIQEVSNRLPTININDMREVTTEKFNSLCITQGNINDIKERVNEIMEQVKELGSSQMAKKGEILKQVKGTMDQLKETMEQLKGKFSSNSSIQDVYSKFAETVQSFNSNGLSELRLDAIDAFLDVYDEFKATYITKYIPENFKGLDFVTLTGSLLDTTVTTASRVFGVIGNCGRYLSFVMYLLLSSTLALCFLKMIKASTTGRRTVESQASTGTVRTRVTNSVRTMNRRFMSMFTDVAGQKDQDEEQGGDQVSEQVDEEQDDAEPMATPLSATGSSVSSLSMASMATLVAIFAVLL